MSSAGPSARNRASAWASDRSRPDSTRRRAEAISRSSTPEGGAELAQRRVASGSSPSADSRSPYTVSASARRPAPAPFAKVSSILRGCQRISGSCQAIGSGTWFSVASPSGPARASRGARIFPATKGSGRAAYSGWIARRSRRRNPRSSVVARRASIAGHGRSGLTWSGVTGETPPQSSIPASSRRER